MPEDPKSVPEHENCYHFAAGRQDFPDGYPLFGRWIPLELFVDNWAATDFLHRFIDQRLHVNLAKHASNTRNGLKCDTDLSAFNAGGQHIVIRVLFEDGVVWLARVRFPRCEIEGHRCVAGFKSFQKASSSMECEIATMKLVKAKTSLPIPTVYAYDLSANNCLGAPYMLIERMPGESIDERVSRDGGIYTHQIRKVDDQVREYISELTALRLDKIGRLGLDNTIISIPDVSDSPFNSAREYYLAIMKTRLHDLGLEKILSGTYLPPLPEWNTAAESEKPELALWIYLQVGKFLGAHACDGPFPVDHGDWNDQNVLVDEEYRVVGVIDCEMVRTCPLESLNPSKLFQYTLKDVSVDYYTGSRNCLQTILGTTRTASPKIHVLAQLFERPYSALHFVTQVHYLTRFLKENFDAELEQMIPLYVWSKLLPVIESRAPS